MNTRPKIQELAKAGTDSVFEYIERTAEEVPDGRRWRTFTFQNETQYAANLFNGVAGISLFLSDYYRMTGESRAADLASGALQWCSAPGQVIRHDFQNTSDGSLGGGWAGIGMAWLQFTEATGDPRGLTEASKTADKLLGLAPAPGGTNFMWGGSGEGFFLIRLWKATGDDRYLSGAVQRGEWLSSRAIRDEKGDHWPCEALGFGPRGCGILSAVAL